MKKTFSKNQKWTYKSCTPSHDKSCPIDDIQLVECNEIHIYVIELNIFSELFIKR